MRGKFKSVKVHKMNELTTHLAMRISKEYSVCDFNRVKDLHYKRKTLPKDLQKDMATLM